MKHPSQSWIIASIAAQTWQKFYKTANQIPRRAWAEWIKVLALGLGLAGLMTLGLTKLGQVVFNAQLQA
ncbi:MAG: hypothetical protein WBA10_10140, partial [Elainellaceae cyanobacterium]